MPFVPDPAPAAAPAGNAASIFSQSAGMSSVVAETSKFAVAAKAGSFRVAPEAVADMRKSITEMRADLFGQLRNEGVLSQRLPLGSHPYGHTVAEHDQKGATGDDGVIGVINNLIQVLDDLDSAFASASASYQEHEAGTADAIAQFRTS